MAAVTATSWPPASPSEMAEVAGIRAAFLVGAILSVMAIVGAFFVRKPADMMDACADAADRSRGLTSTTTA